MSTDQRRSTVRVRVPGKVNLALRVGGRRADGYHELATIFCALSLGDEIEASLADDITCTVRGADAAAVGPAEQNLAYRAAALLRARYKVRAGVDLRIDKQIPVAGGMAGGSADAAGALVACATAWDLPVSRAELMALGAELGADVPFALIGGCALGVGRGEVLTPLTVRGTYHWVLALADGGLTTPAVFAQWDRQQAMMAASVRAPERPPRPEEVEAALGGGDAVALGAGLVNDLADAAIALRPDVGKTMAAGLAEGALGAVVSGSGPTVAFLVRDAAAAAALALTLSREQVVRRAVVATGPVAGAAVRGVPPRGMFT